MVRFSLLAAIVFLLGCGQKPAQETQAPPPRTEPTSDLSFLEPENVPDGVALRLNPAPDASLSYGVDGVITIARVDGKPSVPDSAVGESRLSMDYSVSVANADAGSVSLAFESSPLVLTGKARGEWEQLGGQRGEVRLDRRAALLSDPNSLFEGMFSIGMTMFPENKVGPGSTWFSENTRDMPPFGPVLLTERFVYRGLERKAGEELHRIDSTAAGTLEGMETKSTYWIRMDGMPHSALLEAKATSPIAQTTEGTQLWASIDVRVELKQK